jgi:hypothetical protein
MSATEPAVIEAAGGSPAPAERRRDDRRDRAARRNASALLDELEQVRDDLLRNGVPATRLRRLAMLAAQMTPDDGDLAAICAAIALRARVEAAKLERGVAINPRPARNADAPWHSWTGPTDG